MTAAEYQKSLAGRIGPEEAEALRRGEGLYISEYNRAVCLRLLEDGTAGGAPVPREKADRLEAELRDYLNQYMADRPDGHKWIILACLYLTFVERRPMHPQAAARWIEREGRYYCPSLEPESFICGCCVCERMAEAPEWRIVK